MTSALTQKKCVACEGGARTLDQAQITALHQQTPDWQLNEDGTTISRNLSFNNYYETMAFVNAVAWMAHQENHHPTLTVDYNACHILYTTHALQALSENDFICAAKVDALLQLN